MKKRWKVAPVNTELRALLARELNIRPLTAQLLVNRGLVDSDRAFSFLNPELKDLPGPFLLKDMDKAVERLLCAAAKGELIAVYGDYDVDGTTACALLCLFFKDIGVNAVPYIPDRQSEGYGMNAGAIRKLHAQGVKVIITVDCGSSNYDEVALANTLGIDVIITDHHELPVTAPPALALINPKQHDCPFPFKGLAGVGVAYYLIMALRARLRSVGFFNAVKEPNLKKYLDLVCIGTVADMVPLQGANRVFVSQGLGELENTARPGLVELKKIAGVTAVDADTIAFQLAPRLNAAGRLGQALTSFKLLTTNDQREAASIAAELDTENRNRQRLEEEILNDALSMLEGGEQSVEGSMRYAPCAMRPAPYAKGLNPLRGIVLYSDKWHPGVIGIVASRLVERFYRPVVMIAFDKDGGAGRGSARGIKSFNLLEGLHACSMLSEGVRLLERFGGHKAAAGLTVKRENVEAFSAEFLRYLDTVLTDDDLVPEVSLDAEVKLADFDMKLTEGVQLLHEMARLAPFGMANSKPLFSLVGAHIIQTEIVKEKHLRFKVRQGSAACNGIGFGLARLHPMRGEGYCIAFSPHADEWRGAKNFSLRIKDVQAV